MQQLVLERLCAVQTLLDMVNKMPQVEMPMLKHYFSDGIYAREIFMAKDTLIIGKIHTTRHLNIVSKGKCKVITAVRELDIEAPYTFESIEGEQKVVVMLEDVVWTTIHKTEEVEPEKIVDDITAKKYDKELFDKLVGGAKCLSS